MKDNVFYATGRRKTSVARVWLFPVGNEKDANISVNNKKLNEYFGRKTYAMVINQPFDITETNGKYRVMVRVKGGGKTGQAGAIKHGISRALAQVDDKYRLILRKNGFLTRDSRMVERKKYGKKKARKSPQFSKR